MSYNSYVQHPGRRPKSAGGIQLFLNAGRYARIAVNRKKVMGPVCKDKTIKSIIKIKFVKERVYS